VEPTFRLMPEKCSHLIRSAVIRPGTINEFPDALLLLKGTEGVTQVFDKPFTHQGNTTLLSLGMLGCIDEKQ